jgi:hypothetical protein
MLSARSKQVRHASRQFSISFNRIDPILAMPFAAKYVNYDMRRAWLTVIHLAFIQLKTVIFTIIPRTHYVPVAVVV